MLAPTYRLISDRRVNRRTPTRFRTRVITDGVIPSLHVDCKRSRTKQYFKEDRALRTETVINNSNDFSIGRGLASIAVPVSSLTANFHFFGKSACSLAPVIGRPAVRTCTLQSDSYQTNSCNSLQGISSSVPRRWV